MKTYRTLAVATFATLAVALGGWAVASASPKALSRASSYDPAITNTTAVTEPVNLAKLTPVYPHYAGVTPAPAKNGPFGLVESSPISEAQSAPAPAIQWFATQELLQATLKSVAPNSIIEGVLYENAPPSGRSLTIYGASCNNNGVANLGGSNNFDNITSSLENSCGTITLYADPNYSGARQPYGNGQTSNVGPIMNDQASSVYFNP